MNFIIFPLTYRMQIFNNFTTNFVVMTIPPAMLQCRFNSSSNKPQSNQRKWWKCLVSTLKLMKIQFLFPSNRQMSFSLSSAKGTDPYDQVQFPILNSHEKCKLFLQDIFVTKAQLIVVPCTVFWQGKVKSEGGTELYQGPSLPHQWGLDTEAIIKTKPDRGLLNRYWQTGVVGLSIRESKGSQSQIDFLQGVSTQRGWRLLCRVRSHLLRDQYPGIFDSQDREAE